MAKRHFPRTLQYRFFGYAAALPVLGPIIHWPPEQHGPSVWLFVNKRLLRGQRQAAIEWFSTFMSPEDAKRQYELNDAGMS